MYYLINQEDHEILVLLRRFGYSELEALHILRRCVNCWDLSPVALPYPMAVSSRIQR
jgi:hypothetical protein